MLLRTITRLDDKPLKHIDRICFVFTTKHKIVKSKRPEIGQHTLLSYSVSSEEFTHLRKDVMFHSRIYDQIHKL